MLAAAAFYMLWRRKLSTSAQQAGGGAAAGAGAHPGSIFYNVSGPRFGGPKAGVQGERGIGKEVEGSGKGRKAGKVGGGDEILSKREGSCGLRWAQGLLPLH